MNFETRQETAKSNRHVIRDLVTTRIMDKFKKTKDYREHNPKNY